MLTRAPLTPADIPKPFLEILSLTPGIIFFDLRKIQDTYRHTCTPPWREQVPLRDWLKENVPSQHLAEAPSGQLLAFFGFFTQTPFEFLYSVFLHLGRNCVSRFVIWDWRTTRTLWLWKIVATELVDETEKINIKIAIDLNARFIEQSSVDKSYETHHTRFRWKLLK